MSWQSHRCYVDVNGVVFLAEPASAVEAAHIAPNAVVMSRRQRRHCGVAVTDTVVVRAIPREAVSGG